MHCFAFLCWVKVCIGHFRQAFLHLEDKKVVADDIRQVVVLYRNDCVWIDLSGLKVGHLR